MVSLMYEDPLYDVNYVYGGLLALKYYELYTTRHDWFVPATWPCSRTASTNRPRNCSISS